MSTSSTIDLRSAYSAAAWLLSAASWTLASCGCGQDSSTVHFEQAPAARLNVTVLPPAPDGWELPPDNGEATYRTIHVDDSTFEELLPMVRISHSVLLGVEVSSRRRDAFRAFVEDPRRPRVELMGCTITPAADSTVVFMASGDGALTVGAWSGGVLVAYQRSPLASRALREHIEGMQHGWMPQETRGHLRPERPSLLGAISLNGKFTEAIAMMHEPLEARNHTGGWTESVPEEIRSLPEYSTPIEEWTEPLLFFRLGRP